MDQMIVISDVVSWKWMIASLIIAYLLAHLFRQQLRILWLVFRLPGPVAYPIIGNAYLAVQHKRLIESAYTCRQEHGSVIRVWMTVFPMVLLVEPQDIQKVLGSSKHIEKIYFYKMLHNFLGEGLITSDGKKWRTHRKLIQPAFHLTVLEESVQTFSKSSLYLVDVIEDKIKNGSSYINIASLINKCVVNILYESILGIQIERKTAYKDKSSPFRQGSLKLQYRWMRPWLLFDSIYKLTQLAREEIEQKNALVNHTRQMIKERRKNLNSGLVQTKCYLDHLLEISESNKEFTEEDCIQEACTLMLAGQDSVGAALAFCFHSLARHPEVQQKVHEELDSIFGASQRITTSFDLRGMKYLEQCVKETLRLYPSVPFFARTLQEDVTLGKHVLPKGCEVLFTPFATHRLQEHYPDPDRFDPDRFDPEVVENRHPYAYFPFSAGPRNCIGYKFGIMEMKTVVANILRRYRLTAVPGKENLDLRYRITLRSSGGIWIGFTPRTKSKDPFNERDL